MTWYKQESFGTNIAGIASGFNGKIYSVTNDGSIYNENGILTSYYISEGDSNICSNDRYIFALIINQITNKSNLYTIDPINNSIITVTEHYIPSDINITSIWATTNYVFGVAYRRFLIFQPSVTGNYQVINLDYNLDYFTTHGNKFYYISNGYLNIFNENNPTVPINSFSTTNTFPCLAVNDAENIFNFDNIALNLQYIKPDGTIYKVIDNFPWLDPIFYATPIYNSNATYYNTTNNVVYVNEEGNINIIADNFDFSQYGGTLAFTPLGELYAASYDGVYKYSVIIPPAIKNDHLPIIISTPVVLFLLLLVFALCLIFVR